MTTFTNWTFSVAGNIGPTGATGAGAPLTSSATAPVSPSAGDLWFNTTTGASYIYYNSAWVELGGGSMSPMQTTSSARPAGPWTGQTIYDTDTKIGYQYDGTNWGPTYPGSGFRNKIINGDFRINQRGLTSTTTGGAYGFDRWQHENSGGTGTYSAQSFTVGSPVIQGYESSQFARLVSSGQSAVSDYYLLAQKIEDVRNSDGCTLTVSFYAKTTSGTPSVAVEFEQNFGSGGSTRVLNYVGKTALTTSWTRYSFQITLPSITGKTIGTSSFLALNFWVSAGSNFNSRTGSIGIQNGTFDFWGVQVEQNYQPTPFEQRPIGTELALCQRYYETQRSVTYLMHYSGTATNIIYTKPFAVQKRATPTATNTVVNYTVNTRNFGVYDSSTWYHGGAVASGSTTGNYLDDLSCFFSAEL